MSGRNDFRLSLTKFLHACPSVQRLKFDCAPETLSTDTEHLLLKYGVLPAPGAPYNSTKTNPNSETNIKCLRRIAEEIASTAYMPQSYAPEAYLMAVEILNNRPLSRSSTGETRNQRFDPTACPPPYIPPFASVRYEAPTHQKINPNKGTKTWRWGIYAGTDSARGGYKIIDPLTPADRHLVFRRNVYVDHNVHLISPTRWKRLTMNLAPYALADDYISTDLDLAQADWTENRHPRPQPTTSLTPQGLLQKQREKKARTRRKNRLTKPKTPTQPPPPRQHIQNSQHGTTPPPAPTGVYQYTKADLVHIPASDIQLPNTYRVSPTCPYRQLIREADQHELHRQIEVFNIYQRGYPPRDTKLLRTVMDRNPKTEDGTGMCTRIKSRLCLQGNRMIPGVHFDPEQLSTPVHLPVSMNILLTFASLHRFKLFSGDCDSAYLQGTARREIWIEPSPWHRRYYRDVMHQPLKEGEKLLLTGNLYGDPAAGRRWNTKLDAILKRHGFTPLPQDPCLYRYADGEGFRVILLIHVDDALGAQNDDRKWKPLAAKLSKELRIQAFQQPKVFCGIRIHRETNGSYSIDQTPKITALHHLHYHGPDIPVYEPYKKNWKPSQDDTPLTDDETHQQLSIIGKLLNLSTTTRPDIPQFLQRITKDQRKLQRAHKHALQTTIAYLYTTKDERLNFNPDVTMEPLTLYSDSSFATKEDHRSYQGHVIMLYGSPIHWQTKIIRSVVKSPNEAEYIALSTGGDFAQWIPAVVSFIFDEPKLTMQLKGDNDTSMSIVRNKFITRKTRHFNVIFHAIKEQYEKGIIRLNRVDTLMNLADFFTKTWSRPTLEVFRSIFLINPTYTPSKLQRAKLYAKWINKTQNRE